jgi:hypothetical protein
MFGAVFMDEDTAKKRLLIYSLVRFGGLAIFFFGIAIFYTNLVRPGGWPQLGAIVAIMGALDAVLAPRLLTKAWNAQDRQDQ